MIADIVPLLRHVPRSALDDMTKYLDHEITAAKESRDRETEKRFRKS